MGAVWLTGSDRDTRTYKDLQGPTRTYGALGLFGFGPGVFEGDGAVEDGVGGGGGLDHVCVCGVSTDPSKNFRREVSLGPAQSKFFNPLGELHKLHKPYPPLPHAPARVERPPLYTSLCHEHLDVRAT